tara:strand:- start:417 stop:914 length:498 start_codon:yes stop_codon:yes gene_type:complete
MKNILFLVMVLASFNANAVGSIGSAIAPPLYVGKVLVKGDLGFESKGYKNSLNAAGNLAAHKICDVNFDGARAAEYEDFKYIINDLDNGHYWVIDAYTSKKLISGTSYRTLRKDGTIFTTASNEDGSCDGFKDDSALLNATVVNTSTGALELRACNLDAYVACVK